ncbi:MAG: mandelate racemase/muconate lactonizing enzyme family protein [Dehalococcoidales bacterium]|nr:mandelate racemase/muconate lactonizing enzyme family protein [Dehalococcoidales bacterium]
MKITEIECLPISAPSPMRGEGRISPLLIVKIHTDEGITGIGDAGGVNQEAVIMMIKSWAPFLIGADPLDRNKIMARLVMAIGSVWGMSYPAAVSTIDFALWDLAGKALNQPVYRLLGGKQVDNLRFNFFIHSENSPNGIELAVEEAQKAVAGGVTSIGMKSTGFGGGMRSMEMDIKIVEAVINAVGDKAEVSFDTNAGYDFYDSLVLGRALDDVGLYKFEQPNPVWDIDGLIELRSRLKTPICAHEATVLTPGLMEVIKRKAADIVGTKLSSAGGITAGIQWAAIAKASALGMYCGAMNGPFEAAAQAHWLSTYTEFGKQAQAVFFPVLMYNSFDTTKPNDVDLLKNPMVYKDGYFSPPDGPGLGLELNDEAVPKYITPGMEIVTVGEKERASGRGFF